MKKFLSAIIFLTLFSISGNAQSLLDSIGVNSLHDAMPNDKINYIFNYCEKNLLNSPENVLNVLEAAKQFLIENKNLKRWGEYSYHLANYYFVIENYDSALAYYKKSLTDLKPNSNESIIACFAHISFIEAHLGNIAESKIYLNQLIKRVQASSEPMLQGLMFQQQAYISMLEDNYPNASNYYQNAIAQYRVSGDTLRIGKVYGEISLMYANIGNYPLAIDYLEKAEKIFKKADCQRCLAENFMQKGITFLNSAKYKEALTSFISAEKLFDQLNDRRKLCKVYNEQGKTYVKLLNFNKSLICLYKALELANLFDNKVSKAEVMTNLGDLYSTMGEIPKGQEYYQNSLLLVEKADLKLELYEKISSNYSVLLDFKKAYKYQILYNSLNQNVLTQRKDNQLLLLENKLRAEIESSESENQLLQKELSILVDSKKQKASIYTLLLGVQSVALLVLLLLFLKWKKRNDQVFNKLKNTIRVQRNSLGKNKLDYDKLKKTSERIFNITTKNMWEPYWVLERLSNQLTNQAELDKLTMAKINFDNDQLIMARNLLENVLHWAKHQQGLLELHPKLHNINDLLDPIIKTQGLRAAAKNIEINYTPQFNLVVYADKATSEVALRNILENAIKFSTLNSKISMSTLGHGNSVEIIIADSGVGMTKDQISALFSIRKPYMAAGTHGEKGVGLGLSLTKEFIERNSGTLKIESSIALGTTVRIMLPSSAKVI